MASGPDPDAPDWFEPKPGGDNGAAEAMLATAPATGERSEEREIVYNDDLSPDDNVGGGATTAHTEAEIIEASREFDDAEVPEFQGDVPGFTDWREELRERLKRIRARREQERLAAAKGDSDEDTVAAAEDTREEDDAPGADLEDVAEEGEEISADLEDVAEEGEEISADLEDVAEEGEGIVAEDEAAPERDEEPEADVATEISLGDVEPEPVATQSSGDSDGDLDLAPNAESGADIDFTLDTELSVADPDLDLSEGFADDSPGALILGEKKAEASVPDAEGLDGLIAAESSSLRDEDTPDEAITEPLDAFAWDEAAAKEPVPAEEVDASDLGEETVDEASEATADDRELPAVIMPELPDIDGAPELDFDDTPAAPPEIDLPAVEETDDHALEWDGEGAVAGPTGASSAGPLGERAAAALCDMLVLTAIGAALVGAASSGTGLPFRQVLAGETLWLGLAWSIFAIGYSVFFVGSCGQTIGRMIMRLRVVGDDQFSVGFDRAAIRLAAWVPSALPLLAGLLPALRDPQRRAVHDRLSHTRVVKA